MKISHHLREKEREKREKREKRERELKVVNCLGMTWNKICSDPSSTPLLSLCKPLSFVF
jgi:hypothetical protein